MDVTRWRDETAVCRAGRVHLNNAGAGAMPDPVVAAVRAHLDREAEMGGYEAADEAAEEIEATYAAVAELVGARSPNVAVVENATVAFSQALSAFDFAPGDVLLTTRNDYISNQLMFLAMQQRCGIRVVRAAELPEGGVDPESVRALIREHRPRLVSVTHMPTNSGLVQPAEAVGEVCAELEVPYLVDACQTVGQLAVDVGALHCDFLCATARKFLRGPRGIGFLYVSDDALARGLYPQFVDMRGASWVAADEFALAPDAKRFENWEFAYALVLGLGAAARYALDVGRDVYESRAIELGAALRRRLGDLEGATVLDRGAQRGAIVTVDLGDPRRIVPELRARGIHTTLTLREYAVLDMDDKRVEAAIRLSPHYYNTVAELDRAVAELRALSD